MFSALYLLFFSKTKIYHARTSRPSRPLTERIATYFKNSELFQHLKYGTMINALKRTQSRIVYGAVKG